MAELAPSRGTGAASARRCGAEDDGRFDVDGSAMRAGNGLLIDPTILS